jgi:hypothetical protein
MSERSRFVLAFAPKEETHAVASFPATVYRFYSIEEAKGLFSAAGSPTLKSSESQSQREIPFSQLSGDDAAFRFWIKPRLQTVLLQRCVSRIG